MDKGDKLPSESLRASRSGTTSLKRYEEMLVTSMLGLFTFIMFTYNIFLEV